LETGSYTFDAFYLFAVGGGDGFFGGAFGAEDVAVASDLGGLVGRGFEGLGMGLERGGGGEVRTKM